MILPTRWDGCCCVNLAVASSGVHEGNLGSFGSAPECLGLRLLDALGLFHYLGSMLPLYCRMCSVVCHLPLGPLLLYTARSDVLLYIKQCVRKERLDIQEGRRPRRCEASKPRGQEAQTSQSHNFYFASEAIADL